MDWAKPVRYGGSWAQRKMGHKSPCWHNTAPYGEKNMKWYTKYCTWIHEKLSCFVAFIVYSMLQCMFIPTLTLLQPSEEQKCPLGDYPTEKGICCNKCLAGTVWPPAHLTWFTVAFLFMEISHRPIFSSSIKSILQSVNCVYTWCSCFPGFKLVEKCHAEGQRSNCTTCPDDQYMDEPNYSPNCRSCRRCKGGATLPFSKSVSPLWFVSVVSGYGLLCSLFLPFKLFLSIKAWRGGIIMSIRQKHDL